MQDLYVTRSHQLKLLAFLGRGGMGATWLVEATQSLGDGPPFRRRLCLKRVLSEYAGDTELIQRFLDEARLHGQLHSEHIVNAYDAGIAADGHAYLLMEWVDGSDLRDLIGSYFINNALLPTDAVVDIASQICRALHYLHELVDDNGESLGLVHRDLTPGNVLITRNGTAKLADFGVIKARDKTFQTGVGTRPGRDEYMAPEQFLTMPCDARSDIYSLGIVIYEMLTGVRPFEMEPAVREALQSDDPDVVARVREQMIGALLSKDPAVRDHPIALLRELRPDNGSETGVGEELLELIRTMIDYDADNRPENVRGVLQSLSIMPIAAGGAFELSGRLGRMADIRLEAAEAELAYLRESESECPVALTQPEVSAEPKVVPPKILAKPRGRWLLAAAFVALAALSVFAFVGRHEPVAPTVVKGDVSGTNGHLPAELTSFTQGDLGALTTTARSGAPAQASATTTAPAPSANKQPSSSAPPPADEVSDAGTAAPVPAPNSKSTKTRSRASRARSRMATITVRITGGHWGYIDVDGERVSNRAKASVDVRPGMHQIRVSQGKGGQSESRKIMVSPGEHRNVYFDFGSILEAP